MRRTSLFNRRFALTRKAALDGKTVARDAEGFDDLDAYFAPSPQRIPPPPQSREYEESVKGGDGSSDAEPHYTATEAMDVAPLNDDYDAMPIDNYHDDNDRGNGENVQMDDDNEVSFKPTVKVVKSPRTPEESTRRRSQRHNAVSADEAEAKTPTAPMRKRGRPPGRGRIRAEKIIIEPEGEKKSARKRIAPLAFWRNERVVYGRRQSSRMPVIVDVVRTDEAAQQTTATMNQARRKRGRPRKDAVQRDLKGAGFKAEVAVMAKVMDYDTHRETDRCTPDRGMII